MGKSILLTGHPGIGKTTIIRKVAKTLGSRAGGFTTEEISGPGGRHGIKLVTLYGAEGILAHKDYRPPRYPQVGRYGVDTGALEKVGVKAIEKAIRLQRIVIVDEIDMMTVYSKKFLDVVMGGIMGEAHILGSLMTKSHPEADVFRYLSQAQIWEVDRRNRDAMADRLLAWIDTL